MTQNSSATAHEETPHAIQSTENNTLNVKSTISIAVKCRAQSLIKDTSIDAGARGLIRYALEINDPYLPQLVDAPMRAKPSAIRWTSLKHPKATTVQAKKRLKHWRR